MSKQAGLPKELENVLREIAKGLGGMNDQELDQALLPDERTKASYIPDEYLSEFFDELLEYRGKALATAFIERNGTLAEAFPWQMTKSGGKFWMKVEQETIENFNYHHGINEKTIKKTKVADNNSANALDVMVKEAESRGFAEGVSTKFGLIKSRKTPESDPIDHELCPNGDFYYYNIRVFKDGKWLKPGVKPKKGFNENELSSVPAEVQDAIHDFIRSLGR